MIKYIMRKIILASASPTRKRLLQRLIGDNFEVKESAYEEDNSLAFTPTDLVLYHAIEKGRDVAKHYKKGIIIAADVVIVLNDEVLGKPASPDGAKEMLKAISGNTIEVVSGLAVIDTETDTEFQGSETTKLKFKEMTQQEITDYVDSGEPLNKAGSFAIQERGAIFVEKIEGCSFNVAGLPLFKLNEMLNQLGVSIFDYKL